MGDLAYETATLHANLEQLEEIQGALYTFDESFSMFLYGVKMNAFCVEWPEVRGPRASAAGWGTGLTWSRS